MFEGKSKMELEQILTKLEEDLEEVEEERQFVLGQTGLHVSGGAVKKFEAELEGIKDRMAKCKLAIEKSN